MLWKCCTQYASKYGKLSSGHRTGKGWFSFQSQRRAMPKNAQTPKKGNAKECSNYHTVALISHASKVMLKILQVRFQQYVNWELPDVQSGFRKGRGTRDQITKIRWIIEKAREFQKNIYFCFTDYAKSSVWIRTNCGKFLKRWEYKTTISISWETCMHVKKQQLELDMEQQTGSKLWKESDKLYLVTLLS